jgi:hypothetical protein
MNYVRSLSFFFVLHLPSGEGQASLPCMHIHAL